MLILISYTRRSIGRYYFYSYLKLVSIGVCHGTVEQALEDRAAQGQDKFVRSDGGTVRQLEADICPLLHVKEPTNLNKGIN